MFGEIFLQGFVKRWLGIRFGKNEGNGRNNITSHLIAAKNTVSVRKAAVGLL